MRRLKYSAPPSAAEELDLVIDGVKPRAKRGKATPRAVLAKAGVEAEAMRRTGDWSAAKGKHLVALYAWLHQSIYHVEPAELFQEKAMLCAIGSVDRMVAAEFGGDAKRCVEFIAWVWSREKKSITGRDVGRRITWRLQFVSKSLLTDYRVDAMAGKIR